MNFKNLSLGTIFLALLATAAHVNAEIQSRGVDNNGNQIFYDSEQNITWYDYSHGFGTSSYSDELRWVENLVVSVGTSQISNWRLPTSTGGPWSYGYDGTNTAGFNITSSEMGHLYYSSLRKIGAYDSSGSYRDPIDWLNISYSPFRSIAPGMYFTSTPDPRQPDIKYFFYFYSGYQFAPASQYGAYAIAVHDGDISPVPEPDQTSLFLVGALILLAARAHLGAKQLHQGTAF